MANGNQGRVLAQGAGGIGGGGSIHTPGGMAPRIDEATRERDRADASRSKVRAAALNAVVVACGEAGRNYFLPGDVRVGEMVIRALETIVPVGDRAEDFAPQTHRDKAISPDMRAIERIQQEGLAAVAGAIGDGGDEGQAA